MSLSPARSTDAYVRPSICLSSLAEVIRGHPVRSGQRSSTSRPNPLVAPLRSGGGRKASHHSHKVFRETLTSYGLRAAHNLMPFRARLPCALERRCREVDPRRARRPVTLPYRCLRQHSHAAPHARSRCANAEQTAADDVNVKDAKPLEQTGERHVVLSTDLAGYTGKTGYQCASPDRQDACCLSWPARSARPGWQGKSERGAAISPRSGFRHACVARR